VYKSNGKKNPKGNMETCGTLAGAWHDDRRGRLLLNVDARIY
jgi:hypothetical protein